MEWSRGAYHCLDQHAWGSVIAPAAINRRERGLLLTTGRQGNVNRISLLTSQHLDGQPVLRQRNRARRVRIERARWVVCLIEVEHRRPVVREIRIEESRSLVRLLTTRRISEHEVEPLRSRRERAKLQRLSMQT